MNAVQIETMPSRNLDELTMHLVALETLLVQQSVRSNAGKLSSLLADDFIEFGASGRVWDKASIIEALADEAPTSRALSEFNATQLAEDVVLLTYRSERIYEETGEVVRSLRSSIWCLRSEEWQMNFHQGTLVDADDNL